MAALNSKFDILRGWPHGSAVAEDFTKGTPGGDTDHAFRHGTWVKLGKTHDGTAANMTAAGDMADANSTIGMAGLGFIIEGTEDTSSTMSNTVTCLVGGGFMVRLHRETAESGGFQTAVDGAVDQYAALNIIAGCSVKVENGIIKHDHDTTPQATSVGIVIKDDNTANNTIDVLIY